ncbi:hypothetical protein V1281_001481 [Nitrobacteraceae bacterium AZCC 2161]
MLDKPDDKKPERRPPYVAPVPLFARPDDLRRGRPRPLPPDDDD